MAKIAVDKFIAFVARSGLLTADRLDSLVAEWKASVTVEQLDDAEHLGEFLVGAGALTGWQCHKLLDGRHRGFMLGSYRLLDHLGSGGMSNVYLAEHVLMQRRVAIKVLPENRVADASYLARFHFEGQAVAALDHPNIVRAYDLGSEGRIHYLVMEFVDGSDLEALVERRGPLPCHEAAEYIRQAALGLEHAHSAGLIHRDMKPANLLVDQSGIVKVLDLGLARFTTQVRPVPEFARQEQVLGTAAYFAPEQTVNSQAADARSDVYGLGCTLYFLLTGYPPFRDTTPLELMAAHRERAAPSITAERPEVAHQLASICQRMMAKSPDARFQSAREVAQALDAWLQQERVVGEFTLPAEGSGADRPSSLSDTAAGMRDTKAMLPYVRARQTGSTDSASLSDVIVPPPPPTPPVVPPPRTAPSGAIPIVKPYPDHLPNSGGQSAHRASEAAPAVPHVKVRSVTPRPARGTGIWFAVLLSALVLGAVLLAVVTASR